MESPALREAITKKTLLENAQQKLQNFDDLLCEKCNPPVSGFATIKVKTNIFGEFLRFKMFHIAVKYDHFNEPIVYFLRKVFLNVS